MFRLRCLLLILHIYLNYRLLYSNLDFTREEQLLVKIILNTNYKCQSLNELDTNISRVDNRLDVVRTKILQYIFFSLDFFIFRG